jgi:signal transduction histidine kinase
MFRSLHSRLLAGYILLVVLAVGLVGGALLIGIRRFYLNQARLDLTERAQFIAESLGAAEAGARQARAQEAVERFRQHSSLSLLVFDAERRLLASSRRRDLARGGMDRLPGVAAALAGRTASAVALPARAPSERLYVAVPIWPGGMETTGRPEGAVRISLSLRDVNAALARLSWTAGAGVLLALAVCGLASALLAQGISAPLRRMGALAEAVRSGRFGHEVPVASGDEIGRLAEALNAMSRRLAEAEAERSAFLAAASHELRTPVSNIHATLEALLAGGDASPERRLRFLQGALAEAERLADLVRELTDLTSLEASNGTDRAEAVRVAELVERTLAAAAPRLLEKQLRARVDVERELRVTGDAGRLQQVLANLLDNAIRFSPPGQEIALSASREENRVRITVRDRGPGIPPEALPHVFERFFTADPSRSRRQGGSGLGLYIARTIVEAHGGTIGAASASGGGALLTVALPAADSATFSES